MANRIKRIFTTVRILRNCLILNSSNPRILFHSFSKIVKTPQIFLIAGANSAVTPSIKEFSMEDIKNIDGKLMEASQKGKSSIIKLMDLLKIKLTKVGEAYTDSLEKQIKIVKEAARNGPSSKMWDELPKHRTNTNDMKQQYHQLIATINALRKSVENQAMKFIKDENHLKVIETKCKEMESVVDKYVEQTKKLEAELIAAVRESMKK